MWFLEGWHCFSERNPEEQPYQPEENPVVPDSFTLTFILFLIVFGISPPKIHRQFRIGPTESVLA